MQDIIQISTDRQKGLYDITSQVEQGMVSVYVQGATAAIMIQFYMIDPLLANVWKRCKRKI